jgi:phosphatidylglycerol:prolipoprotein diacylglycerol transferase
VDILNYIIWDPNRTAFSLFGFGVRWYSLCWCIGLLLGYLIVQRLYKEQKIDDKLFDPLFFYVFFGILIGMRLGHCLFYEPGYFLAHPLEIVLPFRITNSGWHYVGYEGLASHGGTIGVFVALWLYARKTKLNIMRVLDDLCIGTPIVACFIRLGNLMNSEIVGKITNVPWAFIFTRVGPEPRHAGQLYEAIAYFIIGVAIWLIYRKHRERVGTGFYFGFCITTIFAFRFFVEFFKDVQEPWEAAMPLNMGQLLSIPFVAVGLYCMLGGKWCRRWGENYQKAVAENKKQK